MLASSLRFSSSFGHDPEHEASYGYLVWCDRGQSAGNGRRGLCWRLDRRRDVFVPYEMLWWVRTEDLSRCLQEWPQLRQLMSVYILEDELLGSLKPDEVQADLDYLALLKKDEPLHEAERRFQHVLNVVRERRGT